MEKLAKVVYYLFETIKNSPNSQIKIWQRKSLTKVKFKIILILRSKFGKDRIYKKLISNFPYTRPKFLCFSTW